MLIAGFILAKDIFVIFKNIVIVLIARFVFAKVSFIVNILFIIDINIKAN